MEKTAVQEKKKKGGRKYKKESKKKKDTPEPWRTLDRGRGTGIDIKEGPPPFVKEEKGQVLEGVVLLDIAGFTTKGGGWGEVHPRNLGQSEEKRSPGGGKYR